MKPLRIERNRNGQKKNQKLDNAPRLRGIYIIDPDDEEHREILKNARRKLERAMEPAMLCKRSPNGITKVLAKSVIGPEKTPRMDYECIMESHESTRQRVKSSQLKKMKITLQAKDLLTRPFK